MKIAPHLIVSLFLIPCTVQAIPLQMDSLMLQQAVLAKRQARVASQLDSLASSLNQLRKTNDSLNKELYYYRAKDDFYVMAVDRQGSHFEWLLGIALAVAGLFTYGIFINRIDGVRKEFSDILSESKKEAIETAYKLHRQAAFNLGIVRVFFEGLGSIGDVLAGEKEELSGTLVSVLVQEAAEWIRAYLLVDNTDRDEVNDIVKQAKSCLTTLIQETGELYEGADLKIDKDKAIDLFDHSEKRAIAKLNQSVGLVNDTSLKTLLMNALVKVEELKTLVNA